MKALLIVFACLSSAHASMESEARAAAWRSRLPAMSSVRSSASMHGYTRGDRLEVSGVPFDSIHPGSRVFFCPGWCGTAVFHVAVRKVWCAWPPHWRWITRGDANACDDATGMSEVEFVGLWRKL